MKRSLIDSIFGRWLLFGLVLAGMILIFIPFVGMMPSAVKKVWLFPFLVSAVFGWIAFRVVRQWQIRPKNIAFSTAVLGAIILQLGTAWDGHRQLEALRRKQLEENSLAAGMYEQIAQQEGAVVEDPTRVRWDVFLAQKYAALKLTTRMVYPWWIFEMVSTSTMGVLLARFLSAESNSIPTEGTKA